MARGTFQAFTLPAFGLNVADHTYVVLDGRHHFGCGGRDSGGTLLVAGIGDIDFGLCLATAAGDAGVQYLLDGLCHQMANRILLPAGIMVDSARGYGLSALRYGAYGRQPGGHFYSPRHAPWPELLACTGRTPQP